MLMTGVSNLSKRRTLEMSSPAVIVRVRPVKEIWGVVRWGRIRWGDKITGDVGVRVRGQTAHWWWEHGRRCGWDGMEG